MKKIYLLSFLLLFVTFVSCDEAPDHEQDEKTIELQHLTQSWALVKYETSTPSNAGSIVVTTQQDGSMSFTFNQDETIVIKDKDVIQAEGLYWLDDSNNTLELTEYHFVDGVEPEGIALLLLPIVANNTMQIELLTQDNFVVSLPYSGSTRFNAYFVRKKL